MVGRAAHAALGCPALAAVVVVVGADGAAVERALRAELGADADRLLYRRQPRARGRPGVVAAPGRGRAPGRAAIHWCCWPTSRGSPPRRWARVVGAAAAHPRAAGVGLAATGRGRSARAAAPLAAATDRRTHRRRGRAHAVAPVCRRVVAVPAEGDEASERRRRRTCSGRGGGRRPRRVAGGRRHGSLGRRWARGCRPGISTCSRQRAHVVIDPEPRATRTRFRRSAGCVPSGRARRRRGGRRARRGPRCWRAGRAARANPSRR